MIQQGKRKNDGKPRMDLIPSTAIQEMAKVLTFGAQKYGAHNWRKGMDWSKVIASAVRHLQAIQAGEDYDEESGLLHAAHVMANMAFLTEYYKDCPFLDDRYRKSPLKIAIDIDDVLADFCHHYAIRYPDVDPRPSTWYHDPKISERLKELVTDESFWSTMPVLNGVGFQPHCYITARPPELWAVTKDWLIKNGFPRAHMLYCVGFGNSKVDAFKESGADVMVDDSLSNFFDFQSHRLPVMLFTASHNQDFEVGVLRTSMDKLNSGCFL